MTQGVALGLGRTALWASIGACAAENRRQGQQGHQRQQGRKISGSTNFMSLLSLKSLLSLLSCTNAAYELFCRAGS